jgi:2-phospho-L-lactate/phosphoenolpyruvate guanylyltransferase
MPNPPGWGVSAYLHYLVDVSMPRGPQSGLQAENVGSLGTAVLIPIKAFSEAKKRLSSRVTSADRNALARAMAAQVIASARPMPTFVVCDDAEVGAWALDLGTFVLSEPGRGLNGAVAAGTSQLRERGFDRVVIAHSDLPLAVDLAWIASFDGITIVPDRAARGTNVISIPLLIPCSVSVSSPRPSTPGLPSQVESLHATSIEDFRFSYGAGSFERHVTEARKLGFRVRVVPNYRLSADVDLPGDLRTATAAHTWPIPRSL